MSKDNQIYPFNNNDLMEAIIKTEELIGKCPPDSERKVYYSDHLKRLLDIQRDRAEMIEMKIG